MIRNNGVQVAILLKKLIVVISWPKEKAQREAQWSSLKP
jgi:hypothetical protein